MAILDRAQLKDLFKSGLRPTEANFADLIDSLALVADVPTKPYRIFSALLSVEGLLDPLNAYIVYQLLEPNTIGDLNFSFGRGNEIIIEEVSGLGSLFINRRFVTVGLLRSDFNFDQVLESDRVSDDTIRLLFTIKSDGTSIPDPTAQPVFYNLPIEIRVYDELVNSGTPIPFPGGGGTIDPDPGQITP